MNTINEKFYEIKKLKTRDIAVLISLVVHLLISQIYWDDFSFEKPDTQPEVVKIRLKPASELMNEKAQQIVNNENRGKEEKTDTKFLSEKNQKYDRQTVASKVDSFNKAGVGVKDGLDQIAATPKPQVKNSKDHADKTSKKGKLSLSDLAMPVAPTKASIASVAKGIKGGDQNSRGLAQNNDFIENLPLGDFTQLNTQEFQFYGFYHRIRQKLEQFWGNSLREKATKLYKSGRRVPANENLITSLRITLDNRGHIVDVEIKGTSGVQDLDEAAIEAFNKAGPFPNPPAGMIQDGIATIEWGFVVKS